jgi:hypothetical protein
MQSSEDIPIGVLRLAAGWEVRPIPGHPGYYATYDGRIICETWGRWIPHPQVLKQSAMSSGHRTVGLRGKTFTVHRLIALTFLDPPEPHQILVRHLDGKPERNSVDNLAWGTDSDNAQDKLRHGTHNLQILTIEQAASIKRRLAAGENPTIIASELGLKVSLLDDIKCGKSWSSAAPEITVADMQRHDHRYGEYDKRQKRETRRKRN